MKSLYNQCLSVSVLSVASLAAISCNEKVSDPAPVDYVLSAAVLPRTGVDGWIAVFDCGNDSLRDSLGYSGMNHLLAVKGSPDGRYLLGRESGRAARVWDLRTRTQVAQTSAGVAHLFVPEHELLITARLLEVYFYTTPSFELDTEIELRLVSMSYIPGSGELVAVRMRGPTDQLGDMSQLVLIDLTTHATIDSFYIPNQSGTGNVQIWNQRLSRDGNSLYVLGSADFSGWLIKYSLESRTVVFRTPIIWSTGELEVTPDGSEVWLTEVTGAPFIGIPISMAHVLVVDAHSGSITDTIRTLGIDPIEGRYINVSEIAFVPGMDKAYVSSIPYSGRQQPVLVVNTESKTVEDLIFPNFDKSAASICVVPKY